MHAAMHTFWQKVAASHKQVAASQRSRLPLMAVLLFQMRRYVQLG